MNYAHKSFAVAITAGGFTCELDSKSQNPYWSTQPSCGVASHVEQTP